MNIYLCSTVRNLMFAILKALDEEDQESFILVIRDQQNLDTNNYDITALPNHIKVGFITRKSIRYKLDSNLSGIILRFLAALNIKMPIFIQKHVSNLLFNEILKESNILTNEVNRLFLFNDRNRMARLFRLAFTDYNIIEDGLANYFGNKLKPLEAFWRAITNHPYKKRFLGDDNRCKTIFLLAPERSPEPLKSKVKPITFISQQNILNVCYSFFRLEQATNDNYSSSWILATQPITIGQLSASGFDIVIYRKLLDHLTKMGKHTVLKVHPREDPARYRTAFPNHEILESKMPLEIMIFGSKGKRNIVSIYSTAGMGFEEYCRRITLIKDEESEYMKDIFSKWQQDVNLLETRISTQLQQMDIS